MRQRQYVISTLSLVQSIRKNFRIFLKLSYMVNSKTNFVSPKFNPTNVLHSHIDSNIFMTF